MQASPAKRTDLRNHHLGRFMPGNGVMLDSGTKGVVCNALGGLLYIVRPLDSESLLLAHDAELVARADLDQAPAVHPPVRRPHLWPQVDRRR